MTASGSTIRPTTRNDDPDKVSINVVRNLAALKDKKITFDNECTAEMMDKIGQIFKIENGFVPDGFLGLKDSYPLFLTGKAAMRLDTGGISPSSRRTSRRWLGASCDASAVSGDQAKAATTFEIGCSPSPPSRASVSRARRALTSCRPATWRCPRRIASRMTSKRTSPCSGRVRRE